MLIRKMFTFFCLLVGVRIALCSNLEYQIVYSGFNGRNRTLDGGARIMPNGLLELTDGTVQQKGHAFHPSPLLFHEPSIGKVQSLSVSFVFAILSTNPESGHGLAFFIAPKKNFSVAFPTQYMGLFNNYTNGDPNSHIFAVELDILSKITTCVTSTATTLASISTAFALCNPLMQEPNPLHW